MLRPRMRLFCPFLMTRLLPTPSLRRRCAAFLRHRTIAGPIILRSIAGAPRQHPRARPFKQEAKMRRRSPRCQVPSREAATSNFGETWPRMPRHCPPLPRAHAPKHMSASLADQRRTDEASRPEWSNEHLPGHPASFVRSVRTVGSPQSCSGARNRCSQLSRVDSVAKT